MAGNSVAVRCCGLVLALATSVGCVSTDGSTNASANLRQITPSFLLPEKDRAQRNLKDAKSLNLKYARYQEMMGQQTEARASYEMVLREQPKNVEAILGVAHLDQLADKPKEAEAGFQKALKLKPNEPMVLAACGQFYTSQKRWPEARQSFEAAVASAPKELGYKQQLAVVKTRSGDVNGGLAIFTEIVGPEKAQYNVACLLKQDGQLAAAADHCRIALKINPTFDPAQAMLVELGQKSTIARTSPRRDANIMQTKATTEQDAPPIRRGAR